MSFHSKWSSTFWNCFSRLWIDYYSWDTVYEQLWDEVFLDIQNYQGRGKCYQPKPKAEADNTYCDLDNSGYHEKPHPIIVLLYIESLK